MLNHRQQMWRLFVLYHRKLSPSFYHLFLNIYPPLPPSFISPSIEMSPNHPAFPAENWVGSDIPPSPTKDRIIWSGGENTDLQVWCLTVTYVEDFFGLFFLLWWEQTMAYNSSSVYIHLLPLISCLLYLLHLFSSSLLPLIFLVFQLFLHFWCFL